MLGCTGGCRMTQDEAIRLDDPPHDFFDVHVSERDILTDWHALNSDVIQEIGALEVAGKLRLKSQAHTQDHNGLELHPFILDQTVLAVEAPLLAEMWEYIKNLFELASAAKMEVHVHIPRAADWSDVNGTVHPNGRGETPIVVASSGISFLGQLMMEIISLRKIIMKSGSGTIMWMFWRNTPWGAWVLNVDKPLTVATTWDDRRLTVPEPCSFSLIKHGASGFHLCFIFQTRLTLPRYLIHKPDFNYHILFNTNKLQFIYR